MSEVAEKVDAVARSSYGRLIALLARRWGDLAAAEDALSEAFAEALRSWPSRGLPAAPERWLLQVAHRRHIDSIRRAVTGRRLESVVAPGPGFDSGDLGDGSLENGALPDERLELMMLCAHPSLDAQVRIPLMLQAVLGISAHRLAAGFAVSSASMSSRLVRAKRKIRQNSIRFSIEDPAERRERLQAILGGLYLAFSLEGDLLGEEACEANLRQEISALLDVLIGLWSSESEVLGLAALMCYQRARDKARLSPDGGWIAFSSQDTRLWDSNLLAKAESLLREAFHCGSLGRFQLEAAIESAQVQARLSGRSNWPQLRQLYEALVQVAPLLGPRVAFAGAYLQNGDPTGAYRRLSELCPDEARYYQPYWATMAAVCRALSLPSEAADAEQKALQIAHGEAQRRFLASLSATKDHREGNLPQ